MKIYGFFVFCTAPVAEEWLLGFGFPTITVEPVGIMLADHRQTFCPRDCYTKAALSKLS